MLKSEQGYVNLGNNETMISQMLKSLSFQDVKTPYNYFFVEELKSSVLITGGMGNVKWEFLDTVEALFANCSLPELPCGTCGHTLFKTFDAAGKPLVN